MVVAPGFIDIQSGSYDNLLVGDGRSLSKVTQGVTTEIMGEAYTPAPVERRAGCIRRLLLRRRRHRRVRAALERLHGPARLRRLAPARWSGTASRSTSARSSARARCAPTCMGQARGCRRCRRSSTRCAPSARSRWRTAPSASARALIYPPGNYASTEELIEIAKAMAPYRRRLHHPHALRGRPVPRGDGRGDPASASEGGVPVEIYHLKAAGKRNWDKAAQAIAKIDSARAAGLDVSADMYPYTAGGTALAACFPPWASADGKLFENLADPATRARIRAEVLGRAIGGLGESLPAGDAGGRACSATSSARRTSSSRTRALAADRARRGAGLGRRADGPDPGGERPARRDVLPR